MKKNLEQLLKEGDDFRELGALVRLVFDAQEGELGKVLRAVLR